MAAAPALPPYPWPVKPQRRMHPVRAYLNDPRDGRQASAFHFGIDVSAPDGTAVHAVEPGTVHRSGPQNIAVVSSASPRTFGYWHVVPAVSHGERVAAAGLLGHVANGWAHVHFAERRAGTGGAYVNPLRAVALTPFQPAGAPTVTGVVFSRAGSLLDPRALRGPVDIVAEAHDLPPLPVLPPWADMPVTVARLRWRLLRGDTVARPWHTPVDLGRTMLPAGAFTRIYAPGTRQNHPGTPGRYRYFLAHTLSTRLFPDGEYRVEVEAANVHAGASTLSVEPAIANGV